MIKNNILIEFFREKNETIESKLNYLRNLNINSKRSGDLIIFKYDSDSDPKFDIQKICNGIIVDIVNLKIVCMSIPNEYNFESFKNSIKFNDCVIEDNIEGSSVNVYYYNNIWNVSTTFSINADETRFRNKKTFRQIFDSLFDLGKNNLDKRYTYNFLIDSSNKELYHVETTNNITGDIINVNLGIKKPAVLYLKDRINNLNVSNYSELMKLVDSFPHDRKGIIIYSRDRLKRTSIISKEFIRKTDILDNQGDIDFICLDSLFKKNNKELILSYYPSYKEYFTEIECKLDNLVGKLHKLYVDVKCKKDTNTITPLIYEKSIRKIHQMYMYKKSIHLGKQSKIKNNDIYDYLSSLDTKYLLYLINYGL